MHDDVDAIFDGLQQVGCGERGVHHRRDAGVDAEPPERLQVEHRHARIARRLPDQQLGVTRVGVRGRYIRASEVQGHETVGGGAGGAASWRQRQKFGRLSIGGGDKNSEGRHGFLECFRGGGICDRVG